MNGLWGGLVSGAKLDIGVGDECGARRGLLLPLLSGGGASKLWRLGAVKQGHTGTLTGVNRDAYATQGGFAALAAAGMGNDLLGAVRHKLTD